MMQASMYRPDETAIGEQLENVRSALLKICDDLGTNGNGALAGRVAPIREKLHDYIPKVAMVGQIKAGKSTLANCLTRRKGLLPSDINPWTSVVTRLYFGHPSGQTTGARFHFFDEEQWTRLASRGGRLGQLTDGLLDDYKRGELVSQITAMRDRARLRLGDSFESLIGKSHRFENISTEVIERYVCAGDAPAERLRNPAAGRYNDITSSAELFFPLEPFGCPFCLIDTPGTNDPLLIREEITLQSLESADYFIVVLSAHQALSESDLGLLRILKALMREKIVVFVNRADEVDNLLGDFDALYAKLKRRLSQELNGADVPIIVGSAAWASGAATDLDPAERAALASVAAHKRTISGIDTLDLLDDRANIDDARLASGLAELEAGLSGLLLEGAAASPFRQAAADLLALARQEGEQVAHRLRNLEGPGSTAGATLAKMDTKALLEALVNHVDKSTANLTKKTELKWTNIREKLAAALDRYVKDERQVILDGMKGLSRSKTIAVDLDALRDKLTLVYTSGFEEIQDMLWNGLRSINVSRSKALDRPGLENLSGLSIRTLGILAIEPQPVRFYRTVTLDLSTDWLTTLFSGQSARVDRVLEAVRRQFTEICDDAIQQGRSEFTTELVSAAENNTADLVRLVQSLDIAISLNNASEAQIAAAREEAERSKALLVQITQELNDLRRMPEFTKLAATDG